MKKRDKGASSATPPSKPSNNGGGSSSTSIRQFFGAAKSKKASAKGSQTDVDRVEIEKENDMSIRDLQDLHIDLDRGLCESVCFKSLFCQLWFSGRKGLDDRECSALLLACYPF